jgi:hypothetical protein
MSEIFDGLISFFASHHAIRAEKTLRVAGMAAKLVPGPKELSPNCGVALRFVYADRDAVLTLLADNHVRIDEVHEYRPPSDEWRKPVTAGSFMRRGRG